jgi:uncharacterized membrane protein
MRGDRNVEFEGPIELVCAVFDDENGAGEALSKLKDAAKSKGRIGVHKAAVITRDEENKLHIKETYGITGQKSGEVGGAMGGVVGLMLGPAGMATMKVAVLRRLAERLREAGFPHEHRLRTFGDTSLTPGTSALLAIVELPWIAEAKQLLAGRARSVLSEALKSEIAERLEEIRTEELVSGEPERVTR